MLFADEIPTTLMKEWHINLRFQAILKDHTSKHDHTSLERPDDENMSKSQMLTQPLMKKWKRAVAGKDGTRGKLGASVGVPELGPVVEMVQYCKVGGKMFTTADRHKGNGSVEFYLGKDQRFGHVEQIFQSHQTPGKTWFVVKPFKEVVRDEDPYRDYPNLNCCLVQTNHEVAKVIDGERIIGHVAILVNPASTFGFPMETISAVGLGTAVSHNIKSVCVLVWLTLVVSNFLGVGGIGGPLRFYHEQDVSCDFCQCLHGVCFILLVT
jgi:hypothetical protein